MDDRVCARCGSTLSPSGGRVICHNGVDCDSARRFCSANHIDDQVFGASVEAPPKQDNQVLSERGSPGAGTASTASERTRILRMVNIVTTGTKMRTGQREIAMLSLQVVTEELAEIFTHAAQSTVDIPSDAMYYA